MANKQARALGSKVEKIALNINYKKTSPPLEVG